MSYLLDTNVVSEPRRTRPAPQVEAWIRSVPKRDLYISALVLGEVRLGIERVRRRGDTRQAELFEIWLDDVRLRFADRVVPIDGAIAEVWGQIDAAAPTPAEDGLMAATAIVHGFTFVTRNVRHVARTGVRLLNPWEAPPA